MGKTVRSVSSDLSLLLSQAIKEGVFFTLNGKYITVHEPKNVKALPAQVDIYTGEVTRFVPASPEGLI